ncbi:uncharacterized protein EI97DRAFT_495222 [Westerdykella ornata]|uniref:Glycosyl transferase family 25 domain-containing protein n=1 Tax=Westerdykella ornata TaxID=318751 RepID=A0A6A6JDW7_WESOR|nr:uncharacterized protein EI97DRAFT_495222 [Westerdykella ornata]KAF2274751.1 hypothetical protein EI97DRAFT_495222 [Westerdykella ornata]
MPSLSRGRLCLALALCAVVLFLVVRSGHQVRSYPKPGFAKQYSLSGTGAVGIGNATLGFEKIFVVNAPWRTDRRDSISLAASYSGMSLEWIDGVQAEDIREKAYPPGNHRQLSDGLKGSWRAHMNALRTIIEQNLSSALIIEDDADWDFRIRSQLSSISHAVPHIPTLVSQKELQAQQHPPSQERLSQADLADRSTVPLSALSSHKTPHHTPYDLTWDVLWLGHCGATLPLPSSASPNRILIPNDRTIPLPKHLKFMRSAPLDAMATLYPPHSRLVHRTNSTLCTIAYAVTQPGARKLLYEFGIRDFSKGYDMALSDYCSGKARAQMEDEAPVPMCVVVQPPVFAHWFDGGNGRSDISAVGASGKPEEGSRYIRWSVRANLEGLVKGEAGLVEQWRDEE